MNELLAHDGYLLELIYGAALQVGRWPAVMAALSAYVGASKALLFTPAVAPAQGGIFYPHGLTQQDLVLWPTCHTGENFCLEGGAAGHGVDDAHDEEDSAAPNAARQHKRHVAGDEAMDVAGYRGFLSPLATSRVISATFPAIDEPKLPAVRCSFIRTVDAEAFGSAARVQLRLAIPHLARALAVMFRLRDAEHRVATSANALQMLGSGVLMFDGAGKVVFTNRAAERLLTQERGLSIAEGQLAIADPLLQRNWLAALRLSLAPRVMPQVAQVAALVALTGLGSTPTCMLRLSRLPVIARLNGSLGTAQLIAFITEARGWAAQIDPALLTSTWGLSRAESRTATAICEGGKLGDIAGCLGLSANTLKSQLKQVYLKTGCVSRADLSSMMLHLSHGTEAG